MNQDEFKPTDAQRRIALDLPRERVEDLFSPFRRGADRSEEIRAAMVCAIAMSLYRYNVPPTARVRAIAEIFDRDRLPRADDDDLLRWVDNPCWATEMPMATAFAYMRCALDKYGAEAATRIRRHEELLDGALVGILGSIVIPW